LPFNTERILAVENIPNGVTVLETFDSEDNIVSNGKNVYSYLATHIAGGK